MFLQKLHLFLPFPVEHKIKKKEDLSIYKYLLTNIQPVPNFNNFQKVVDYIGDDGLATASGPPYTTFEIA